MRAAALIPKLYLGCSANASSGAYSKAVFGVAALIRAAALIPNLYLGCCANASSGAYSKAVFGVQR